VNNKSKMLNMFMYMPKCAKKAVTLSGKNKNPTDAQEGHDATRKPRAEAVDVVPIDFAGHVFGCRKTWA
jgi:hypothetical protein